MARAEKKLLKYTEWQSGSGYFYCGDTSDLSGIAGKWWIPCRLLNKTPVEYVKWLIDNFHPDTINFNTTLIYCWKPEHYQLAHSFVLYINKIARQKNFFI